jgi:hypothetical protein
MPSMRCSTSIGQSVNILMKRHRKRSAPSSDSTTFMSLKALCALIEVVGPSWEEDEGNKRGVLFSDRLWWKKSANKITPCVVNKLSSPSTKLGHFIWSHMLCREICPSVLRSSRALAAELKARFQPQGVSIKQLDGSPHLFSTFTTGAARSSSRRPSLNLT